MIFKKDIFIFALIGLLLGIVYDQLLHHSYSGLFFYSFIMLFAYLYVLSYNGLNKVRLIGSSLLVALFLSIPLIAINSNSPFETVLNETIREVTLIALFPLFVYIGHCFHYAYHHESTWKINYNTLFAAVWNTFLILLLASIFEGIAHILILLTAFIFKTVGIVYLWDLYSSSHFQLIFGLTVFFMGIGVAQQNLDLIYSMRFLLLKMMYFLFPFLAVISCLYLILFSAHAVSQQTEYVNSIALLTPLIILGILFFNAYFQDGTMGKDLSAGFKTFYKVYRVVLFILTLVCSYKILKQTFNINLLLNLLLVLMFSFTYAISTFVSESKEVSWIRTGNILSALVFIVGLFLFNLPYLTAGVNESLTRIWDYSGFLADFK